MNTATDRLAALATGGGQAANLVETLTTNVAAIETSITYATKGIDQALLGIESATDRIHNVEAVLIPNLDAGLETATDILSNIQDVLIPNLDAGLETATSGIKALETSITYATKGIQDEIIPRLITATGGIATLATGTQHEFANIDASLDFATERISYLATGGGIAADSGGSTATEIANAVMQQTTADHQTDGTFAGDVFGSLQSATDQISALAVSMQVATSGISDIYHQTEQQVLHV